MFGLSPEDDLEGFEGSWSVTDEETELFGSTTTTAVAGGSGMCFEGLEGAET